MTDSTTPRRLPPGNEDSPPFGRAWGPLYAIVAAWLLLLMLLFHAFTRAFA